MQERKELINNGELIGIYSIKTPSSGIYIGMTCVGFNKRWSGHYKDLNNGRHKTKGLVNAFKKYGFDVLEFTILESWEKPGTIQELIELEKEILIAEKYWWEFHKNIGFNMIHGCPTGTGSVIHSEETRNRIRKAALNNKNSSNKETYKIKKVPYNILSKINKDILLKIEELYAKEENLFSISEKLKLNKSVCLVALKIIINGDPDSKIYQKCLNCDAMIEIKTDRLRKYCSNKCSSKQQNSNKKQLEAEDVKKLYWDEKLSANQIGEKYGYSGQAIRNYMRKNGIPLLGERHQRK